MIKARSADRRVLIVQFSANRDGSAISGLLLADGLRASGWDTHVAFGFDGPIIRDYVRSGHAAQVVEHKSWLRTDRYKTLLRDSLNHVRAYVAFRSIISDLRPDVVYVNTSVSGTAALAARRCGVPVVWHIRELFDDVGGEIRAPRGLKSLVRILLRRLPSTIIANSRAVAGNVLGPKGAGRAHVVPNAVSDAYFDVSVQKLDARRALGLPAEGHVLGVPGTLRPMKGHPFFFRAAAHLSASKVRIAVTGTGSPAYERELSNLVHGLGISDRVTFTGAVEDMRAFYRACDLVCVPSEAEPFGRTVIEAFASRTPVIATRVGGIPEIIEHGRTGLLVEYGDVEGLAGSIDSLLNDAMLRDALADRARREAEQKYRVTTYQQRLEKIVARAAGLHASSGQSDREVIALREEFAA